MIKNKKILKKFKHHKEFQNMQEIWKLFAESGLDTSILNVLLQLSPKSEFSPKGFIAYLLLIHDII